MIVGICAIHLHLPEADSLKGKRRIVKSIVGQIRARFNMSVAEVAEQDRWQHAVLGLAMISTDAAFIHQNFAAAVAHVEKHGEAVLVDYSVEIL